MESPLDEQMPPQEPTNLEGMDLKHADSDSVNSIPPPPPLMGIVVPVAREESDDLTEAERLKAQQDADEQLLLQQQQLQNEYEHPHQHQQQLQQQHDEKDGVDNNDNCCEKILKCMGLIPCPSLLSWIVLLLGIGCLTGSLLVATWRTRDLLKDDDLLWFMEYTIIGVVVGMFVIGSLLLTAGHLSSEPTSRRVFNSFSKNRCAQGMNLLALVTAYILAISWALLTALLATPLVFIINLFLIKVDTLDLRYYGFSGTYSGTELDEFKKEAENLLICYAVAFFAAVLMINSMVCFIICISSNIAHLRDNRFATLNAYGAEEVRNSKHSVLDTNM